MAGMPDWRHNRFGRAVVSRRAAVIVVGLILSALIVAGGFLIGSNLRPPPPSPGPTNQPTAQTAVAQPASPPPTSTPSQLTPLEANFADLASRLHAKIGLAVSAVGSTQTPSTLGDWQSGPAWSTIKVPLAIAGLRADNSSTPSVQMKAAITESDNAAAESIWQGLGDPATAAAKVQEVLREYGDFTTVESRKIRPEYTAFGQTQWSLSNQALFLASAACDSRNAPIFGLMEQVEPDQSWGIGTIAGTQFKGGWGPSLAGNYLVRQIGILSTGNRKTAVAIAAEPASGSFADGTQDLNEVANWLNDHLADLPVGECPAD